jgi:hypothetical protein
MVDLIPSGIRRDRAGIRDGSLFRMILGLIPSMVLFPHLLLRHPSLRGLMKSPSDSYCPAVIAIIDLINISRVVKKHLKKSLA